MQAISKKILLVSLVLSLFTVGCLETLNVLAAPSGAPGDGNGVIRITGTPANGSLTINASGQLAVPTAGSSAGILIGGDGQIYRSAANKLSLGNDDNLRIAHVGNVADGFSLVSTTAGNDSARLFFYNEGTGGANGVSMRSTAGGSLLIATGATAGTGSGTTRLQIDSTGAVSIPGALTVGSCTNCGGGGGAPTGATYITQTADATLTAEQALSTLATGYVKVTTGTGVLTSQAAPILVADGGTGTATGSITGTGNLIFTAGPAGAVAIKPGVNSAAAIQLQNAAGTTAILNVDSTNSRLGVLTSTPLATLHVNGAVLLPGSSGNTMTRPTVGTTRITGEIAGGSTSLAADDGFLRLSAGGGTAANTKSYIDLSGYSTLTDMVRTIVFGTGGSERMRLDATGKLGIGTASADAKLSVAGSIDVNSQGTLTSFAADNVQLRSNFKSSTTTLWDTAKSSWAIIAGDGADTFSIYRAPATASTPAYAELLDLSSSAGGTLTIGGGTGKLNVGTVDPPYTINGKGYATYLPSMTGVKEETAGVLKLECSNGICKREINFGTAAEGSDLWLFAKTTNLKKNFGNMVVLVTPSFEGYVWYEKDASQNKLTIFAIPTGTNNSPEASYRLTAPRFDAANHSNFRSNITEAPGFIIND